MAFLSEVLSDVVSLRLLPTDILARIHISFSRSFNFGKSRTFVQDILNQIILTG